jgi:hypothetical protein
MGSCDNQSRMSQWVPVAMNFATLSSQQSSTTNQIPRSDDFGMDIAYLTEDAYIDYRRRQDDLLQREFENIRQEFAKQHNHFEELKVDFLRMQGQMHNRSIRNLFLNIEPIGINQPGTGLVMPTLFPKRAYDFWRLRAPRTSAESTYSQECNISGRVYYRWLT